MSFAHFLSSTDSFTYSGYWQPWFSRHSCQTLVCFLLAHRSLLILARLKPATSTDKGTADSQPVLAAHKPASGSNSNQSPARSLVPREMQQHEPNSSVGQGQLNHVNVLFNLSWSHFATAVVQLCNCKHIQLLLTFPSRGQCLKGAVALVLSTCKLLLHHGDL